MADFKIIETQEDFDKAVSARIKREQETVRKEYEGFLSPEDVQMKYGGFLSPEQVQEKYKDYLSPEEVEKKDATIKSYETNTKRVEIALGAGIPYELAGKISGETEEDMKKDAQMLAGFLKNNKSYPSYTPDPTGEEDSKKTAMKKMLSDLGGN